MMTANAVSLVGSFCAHVSTEPSLCKTTGAQKQCLQDDVIAGIHSIMTGNHIALLVSVSSSEVIAHFSLTTASDI